MARLMERYRTEIVPQLQKELGYTNPMAVPRLEKISLNMGVGKATENKNRIPAAVKDLAAITGQQPVTTRSRQAVAGFKLRENQEIGCKVTLRGRRMYEFLDRLISIVLPRVRDFRGLSPKSYDRAGNYSMGLADQIVFPEIAADRVEFPQGVDGTLTVRARKPEDSKALLKALGMPFRTQDAAKT